MYTVYESVILFIFAGIWSLPVRQDVQHPLSGGEGAVGGEEDRDEGCVLHGEGVEEVKDQLLLCPSLYTL